MKLIKNPNDLSKRTGRFSSSLLPDQLLSSLFSSLFILNNHAVYGELTGDKAVQRLGFDLSDTLTRYAHLAANFLQRISLPSSKP